MLHYYVREFACWRFMCMLKALSMLAFHMYVKGFEYGGNLHLFTRHWVTP